MAARSSPVHLQQFQSRLETVTPPPSDSNQDRLLAAMERARMNVTEPPGRDGPSAESVIAGALQTMPQDSPRTRALVRRAARVLSLNSVPEERHKEGILEHGVSPDLPIQRVAQAKSPRVAQAKSPQEDLLEWDSEDCECQLPSRKDLGRYFRHLQQDELKEGEHLAQDLARKCCKNILAALKSRPSLFNEPASKQDLQGKLTRTLKNASESIHQRVVDLCFQCLGSEKSVKEIKSPLWTNSAELTAILQQSMPRRMQEK